MHPPLLSAKQVPKRTASINQITRMLAYHYICPIFRPSLWHRTNFD